MLHGVVHTASSRDRAGAKLVLHDVQQQLPVARTGVGRRGGYADVRGLQLLPRRWVVERTFAWSARCRVLARDDGTTARAQAVIDVAMIDGAVIRLMAARLAGEDIQPSGPIEPEAARRLTEHLDQQQLSAA